MPYADGKLKRRVRARRNDLFMMSSELSFTPSAPKPSLPVLDDAHVLTDKSGAVASLEQLVTSLNCLLVPITCRLNFGRSGLTLCTGPKRAWTSIWRYQNWHGRFFWPSLCCIWSECCRDHRRIHVRRPGLDMSEQDHESACLA